MNNSKLIQKYNCYLFAIVALALSQGSLAAFPIPIPIPIPNPRNVKPYDDKQIGFIEINETNIDEVIARLGYPSEVRKDGDVFLYHRAITKAVIVSAGFGNHKNISKRFYLLIEFNDDDTVKAFESLSGRKPVFQSGIGVSYSFFGETFLFDTAEEDEKAKQFKPPANKAVIYLYVANYMSSSVFTIDGQKLVPTKLDGFFRWDVDPGNHKVWARGVTPPVISSALPPLIYQHPPVGNIDLVCEEGQIYIISLERTKSKSKDGRIIDVSLVDYEEGSREISNRKLLL